MIKQQTLTGFERYGKTTRRAQFLADMQVIVPWAQLTAVIEPFYPKISEAGGRPPLPLERMLRVYFLQLWFNLSDPAVEESLYDSVSMRNFVGIDLGMEGAPDETTVCKFRHLLEKHKLGKKLLVSVNEHLRRSGIKITTGTIVDATIIGAPSSTKNKEGKRDPEMHAKDFTNQRYRWGNRIDETVKATNRRKSSVRAKVEHMFGIIKRVFGFQKVCYRGLAKNLHRLEATAALANLFLMRRRLLNA